MAKCGNCDGTGTCPRCNGTGSEKDKDPHPRSGYINKNTGVVKCYGCQGSGTCWVCKGKGKI